MDNYTKYILLSHLYWIEKGITEEQIYTAYEEIKDRDIFANVNMLQIQENIGYKINYKEVITAAEYDKIKFLWLGHYKFHINLSFLKFCSNLQDFNLECLDEVNLDSLKHNFKLKKIIANSNKLSNIEALHTHSDLEYINIENNSCLSLKPIAHLKKIKELKVGFIDDEKYALYILKNNPVCTVVYLIKGGETEFKNLNISYYQLIITKNENRIKFIMEGIEHTSSFPTDTNLQERITDNSELFQKVSDHVKEEILNRLRIILNKPIVFDFQNFYSYYNSYYHKYTHIL